MFRFEPKKRIQTTQATGQQNFYGRYLFNPGTQVNEVFVPYQVGCLIFKLIPGQNPEDGGATLDPLVIPGTNQFGSWQTSIPVVSCGKGDKRINYCPWTSYGDQTGMDTNPYVLVYNMVSKMNKLPVGDHNRVEAWTGLLFDGSNMGGATLTKMTTHTLAFCAPVYKKTEVYDISKTRKWLHVLNLSTAPARALRDMLNELMDSHQQIDPLDFKTGPFIQMFSGRAGDPESGEGGNKDSREYFARFTPMVPGTSITCDLSRYEEDYKELLRPWDYLIQCPSKEQQALWLLDVLPPDMLAQAWKDAVGAYYPFVTPEIAARLELGCKKALENEMAKNVALMARFQSQYSPQQPTYQAMPQQPTAQPQQPTTPPAYPPVPPQYKNMMSRDIPFDMPGEDLEQL